MNRTFIDLWPHRTRAISSTIGIEIRIVIGIAGRDRRSPAILEQRPIQFVFAWPAVSGASSKACAGGHNVPAPLYEGIERLVSTLIKGGTIISPGGARLPPKRRRHHQTSSRQRRALAGASQRTCVSIGIRREPAQRAVDGPTHAENQPGVAHRTVRFDDQWRGTSDISLLAVKQQMFDPVRRKGCQIHIQTHDVVAGIRVLRVAVMNPDSTVRKGRRRGLRRWSHDDKIRIRGDT